MDIREIRLAQLKALLAEQEKPRQVNLSKLIKKSPSQIAQWMSRARTITEESAREIERNAKRPSGWLDQPSPGAADTTQTYPALGPSTTDATSVAPPPRPNPRFKDRRDVSESEFALLKATQLVLTADEQKAILERARKIEELAERLVAERGGKGPS